MVCTVFAEAFAAHVLVAGLAVMATEPAAFIAQKLDLLLLRVRKRVQLFKFLVEPKIRNNVTEFIAVQFGDKLLKVSNHLRGRRDEIKPGILCLDVIEQKVRVDDDAGAVFTCTVICTIFARSISRATLEHPAQLVAPRIIKVFFAN